MLDSVQPHRRQPTRLPRPWDSPGKITGVGCHFLLQCMKVKSESEVAQSGPTLSDPMDCSLPGSSVHGIFQARVLEWGAIEGSENFRSNLNSILITDVCRALYSSQASLYFYHHYLSYVIEKKALSTGEDSDAGRDWGQELKGTTEDEIAGWHH